jgi:hypothetical protein
VGRGTGRREGSGREGRGRMGEKGEQSTNCLNFLSGALYVCPGKKKKKATPPLHFIFVNV